MTDTTQTPPTTRPPSEFLESVEREARQVYARTLQAVAGKARSLHEHLDPMTVAIARSGTDTFLPIEG